MVSLHGIHLPTEQFVGSGRVPVASKVAMNARSIATLAASAIIALAAACGGGEPPPAQPTNPPPSAAPADSTPPAASAAPAASAPPAASAADATPPPPSQPGPGDWDKWSHEQKLAWMKVGVMPKMGPLFHDYDAKAYDEPKCMLCHGAGAKDGTFKMPNPDLPKLPATEAGLKGLAAKHPKIFGFMAKQVEPTMASLLGEQPYDMKTKQGFNCFGCHTKK
jgi:hypothetical protein